MINNEDLSFNPERGCKYRTFLRKQDFAEKKLSFVVEM
jgi:hypothetical protein